jgi:hypothetical protein
MDMKSIVGAATGVNIHVEFHRWITNLYQLSFIPGKRHYFNAYLGTGNMPGSG